MVLTFRGPDVSLNYIVNKLLGLNQARNLRYRPDFFYLLIYGNFFSDLGWGDRIKSSENDQLTGHFQSFFFFSFSEHFFFFF